MQRRLRRQDSHPVCVRVPRLRARPGTIGVRRAWFPELNELEEEYGESGEADEDLYRDR